MAIVYSPTDCSNRSRLIFRNLPPSLTADQFKSHLASPPSLKGTTVTDTKIVSKRRFAFVGYKTEDDAKRAQQWFDGSFSFGGGKVKVEVVRDDVSARCKSARVLPDLMPRHWWTPANHSAVIRKTSEKDQDGADKRR